MHYDLWLRIALVAGGVAVEVLLIGRVGKSAGVHRGEWIVHHVAITIIALSDAGIGNIGIGRQKPACHRILHSPVHVIEAHCTECRLPGVSLPGDRIDPRQHAGSGRTRAGAAVTPQPEGGEALLDQAGAVAVLDARDASLQVFTYVVGRIRPRGRATDDRNLAAAGVDVMTEVVDPAGDDLLEQISDEIRGLIPTWAAVDRAPAQVILVISELNRFTGAVDDARVVVARPADAEPVAIGGVPLLS